MTTGNQYRSDSFPAKPGATACLPSVRAGTPAGSSTPPSLERSNGRLYCLGGLSLFRECVVALIVCLLACVSVPVAAQAGMPTVTPVAVQPIGPAPGGGVQTRVTYEMRLAANDAGVASAANDARYVSRAVTVAGPTMGGIVRGVVAGGLRLTGWVGAAMLAYEVYKWYTNPSTNALTAPGVNVVGATCISGGSYFTANNGVGCSAPGAAQAWDRYYLATFSYVVSSKTTACMPAIGGTCVAVQHYVRNDNAAFNANVTMQWVKTGAVAGKDPDYVTDPTPVTDTQLGDLAQQHPEWWPDMLRDPLTNQPLITPEIADDMDALKHEIAPEYGVDPQTIPQTTPDPNYHQGQAEPRPQSMPDFCSWASRACQHYDFVEDKLTIPTFDPTMGPDDPVSSVFVDKTDDGLTALDGSGFLGGGSCPGFPPIEYFGQTINYGEGLCRTAALIGPWLVGMGYAMALLIGLRLKAGG